MEKYYLMAIKLGDIKAMKNLGNYYKMKKCYLIDIESGNKYIMNKCKKIIIFMIIKLLTLY